MAPDFDPYHQWLGIPPKEQPANHYRLLGVTLLETNRDVIAVAANRQMSYLQELASGPDVAEAQKLLSEISQARACLLNAKQKAVYDQQLRSVLPAVETEEPEEEAQQHVAVQRPDEARSARPARSRSGTARRPAPRASSPSKQNQNLPLLITVAGVTAVAVAFLIVLLIGGSGKSKKTKAGEKLTGSDPSSDTSRTTGNNFRTKSDGGIPSLDLAASNVDPPKRKPQAAAPKKPKPEPTPKPAPPKPKPVSTPTPTPAGDDDPEAAAAALLQSKGLEEGFNGTWELAELTAAYEQAINATLGQGGNTAFENELQQRIEARRRELTKRFQWLQNQQPDNGGPLDQEYNKLVGLLQNFGPEAARIRSELQSESTTTISAGPSDAQITAAKQLKDSYAKLAKDPEVQAALKTVDGKLAEPPNEPASTEQAPAGEPDTQVADSDNADDEDHVQPPSETNNEGKNKPDKEDPQTTPVATDATEKAEEKAPSQPAATFDELKEQLTGAEKQTKMSYAKFNKEVKEYTKRRKEFLKVIKPLQGQITQLQAQLDAMRDGERKVAFGQQIEAGPMKRLKGLQQKLSGLPKPDSGQVEAGLATAEKLLEQIRGKPEYAENQSSIENLVKKIEKTKKAFAGAQRKLAKKPK